MPMRYVELRRHTLRDADNPHISQAGLDLARRVGRTLGPFVRVVTSPAPRCIETAIAMGFAPDELYEPVQEQMKKKHVREVEALLPFDTGFTQRAKIMKVQKSTRKYARALVAQWTALAQRIADGECALVITHGGYIDDSAVACLPNANHRKWGKNFAQCEGIRLSFDKDQFFSGELLRI